jgi:hypothetical protein
MKKRLLVVIALFSLLGFIPDNTNSQTGFNTVLEYCTGTWCQWCPCGHTIINDILVSFPNTMILSYHGAGSDPWLSYSLPMIQMFGFNAYPTGVVGRKTGIISRGQWNNEVFSQNYFDTPYVAIDFSNYAYNNGTRTITGNVVCTPLRTLTGAYYVNLVLTEDNLVYPQTGNGSCPGGSSYVHKHVVKGLMNGSTGQLVYSGTWNQGNTINIAINYAIPGGFVESNCKVNAFIYKQGAVHVSTDYNVMQSKITPAMGVTGIVNQNGVANSYSLEQNYPNPFNPTTNIKFSIPSAGHATLKIYDAIGNEVATYLDEVIQPGIYNADFDGSNLSSGVYFYVLKAGSFSETKKMMLVK